MKKFTLVIICSILLSITGRSQTTLSQGQIAFTGMNCDGIPDAFSFVILRPGGIVIGTPINFTDIGYCRIGLGNCSSTENFVAPADVPATDGVILWVSSSFIGYGTQVSVSGLTSSHGTVLAGTNAASGLNLSSSGDQIFAYQGNLYSGTLLAGIQLNNQAGATDASWDGNAMSTFSQNTSILPPALVTGISAMRIDTEVDNVRFNCTGITGSAFNDMLAINNRSNYSVDDFTPFAFPNPLCSVLPVTLTQFNAQVINNEVQLNWKTSREVTFSHFIVERSIDGSHFSEVSRIEPLPGTMEKSYVFTDKQAVTIYSGNNKLYYRLKLVDIDGNYEHSQIILVSLKSNTDIIAAVGPNPFTDKISISLNLPAKGILNIRLTDINGRRVLSKQVIAPKGYSTITEIIPVKSGNAIYWLQVEYAGKLFTRKFIKK